MTWHAIATDKCWTMLPLLSTPVLMHDAQMQSCLTMDAVTGLAVPLTVAMIVMLCAPGVAGAMMTAQNTEVPGVTEGCSRCRPAPPCHAQPCSSCCGTRGAVATTTPSTCQGQHSPCPASSASIYEAALSKQCLALADSLCHTNSPALCIWSKQLDI